MSGESAIVGMELLTKMVSRLRLSIEGKFSHICYSHKRISPPACLPIRSDTSHSPQFTSLTQSQHIMASELIDLINEYYEAKKPYNQLLRDAHTDPAPQPSAPETNTSTTESQEPQFSISPRIPNAEITDVLKKLEAFKIEYARGDKSTVNASAEKKGKAPAGKK